ncbi:hypothetical protein BH11PAT3_BH11PAT3_0040 [soil metagenome]
MKNLFLALVFLGSLSFSPQPTLAATVDKTAPAEYQMLAPVPQLLNPKTGKADLATFLPAVVKLMIGLAIAFALLKIFQGGIMYLSTDAFSGKSEGRKVITDALIGLLLTIGAYTLLYTINPRLVKFTLAIPNNQTAVDSYTGVNGNGLDSVSSTYPTNWVDGKVWDDDKQVRKTLSDGRIGFNANNCVKIGEKGCTSVYGLTTPVGDKLLDLQKKCESWKNSCRVIITGGTEYWLHGNRSTDINKNPTSHKPWKGMVVDLSLGNQPLHDFLEAKGMVPIGDDRTSCTSGSERYIYNGGLYVNEIISGNTPHWHVCFGNSSGLESQLSSPENGDW